MSVINFTVHYDQFASRTDSDDAGLDADLIPLVGTVVFTAATVDGRPVMAPTLSPRPAGLKFRPFIGHIDSDGRLKSAPGGTVGVRLWANDPKFNLERLSYRVFFNLTTQMGEKVEVEGGLFEAPSEDTSVNLASVLKTADVFRRGYGISRSQSYLDDDYNLVLVREDGFALDPIVLTDFPNPVAAAYAMTFGRQ